MKNGMRWILPLLLILFGSGACLAQSINAGDIRGSVTDTTGALIPGVRVTVLNVDTGVSKDFATNNDGLYDTSSIVNGSYKLTFAKQGFDKLVRGPVTIEVGFTTVNAQLKVGSTNIEVTVTEDVPLMHTETGDQTSTLESHDMMQLPNVGGGNGPDWQNFMILLPGATGAAGAGGNANAANPGQEVSTNGNLPFTNVLADGATTTLPSSQNANPAAFEDVEELQVSLSSFSAQYGVGGLIINQITKGGASKFHGSVYDYLQNDTPGGFSLNAAPFNFGRPNGGTNFLRYDDYGGTVSGPVAVLGLRKKAFFFFGYDQIKNSGVSTSVNTVPTAAWMKGDFGQVTGANVIYDPTTQIIKVDTAGTSYPQRQSFAWEYAHNAAGLVAPPATPVYPTPAGESTNSIPTSLLDPVAVNYQNAVYPTATNHVPYGEFLAGSLTNGLTANNWASKYPNPSPWKRYFGRLDFDITPNNRLTMSDTQGDQIETHNGPIAPCPIGCQFGDVDNNNAQITDVWNISGRTINEFRVGYTDQLNFFSDGGSFKGFTTTTMGWKFAEADVMPFMDLPSFGNQWYGMTPGTNAQYKEFVYDPSDVITMIRGKHILHFGGEFAMYRDDTTPWGNISSGEMNWTGQYTNDWNVDGDTGVATPNPNSGQPYADFLLGYAQSWHANISPEVEWRLIKPQMFVQDDWKLSPSLTINLGLRYEISHGMSERNGNMTSFDPTVMNPATGTLGAQWYAATAANGRTDLQKDVFNTYLPRAGFAWAMKPNTTLRGGVGIYSYNWSQDGYGSGMGQAFADNGSGGDQSNGLYPYVKLSGTGTTFPLGGGTSTALPWVTSTSGMAALTSPTRFNGTGTNFNDYFTPIPKIYQYSVGIERQLTANIAATLSYVGSHGLNLITLTDINSVVGSARSAHSASVCGVSGSQTTNCERPFPIYTGIGGNLYLGVSNYNSIQATVTKRMSQGLSFSFNYVWSHMLDDQDSSGWGSRMGPQPWQYASTLTLNNASQNYGNSNFDVRQSFKGYVVYQLPMGKGKQYLNNNALADAVIGGWQITGSLVESAGNPFGVTDGGNTWQSSGSQFPNRVVGTSVYPNGRKSSENWNMWYNPGAFSQPADGQYGTTGRNSLVGPGINLVTLSGGKTFALPWEGAKFAVRVDANNAFNHPSFSNPGTGLGGAPSLGQPFTTPGSPQITSLVVGGRTVQLGARLSF